MDEELEIIIGCKLDVYKSLNDRDIIRAEILNIRDEEPKYYVHYLNYNKRLDEWIYTDKLILRDVEYPKKKRPTTAQKTEKPKKHSKGECEQQKDSERIYNVKNVQKIQINEYIVDAWYFSPYPKKIAESPIIYICPFCLFYFGEIDQYVSHCTICDLRHPPGNEIYRHNGLSFFEIDGHVQKTYCRNLCLLSKLFLDHKTLFYDIDPFLFYILCEHKSDGYHIVGYFSKEKENTQGYNVACLLTLPFHQRKGYGRVLIEFSYLLSKREGVSASPEKPLSDLGLLSYKKYWKEKIFALLSESKSISISEISKITSITEDDIVGLLSDENAIKFYDSDPIFLLDKIYEPKNIIDEKSLDWVPYRVISKTNQP